MEFNACAFGGERDGRTRTEVEREIVLELNKKRGDRFIFNTQSNGFKLLFFIVF